MDAMIFNQTLAHIQKQFQNNYDVSSTIRHKGERGRQRENGLLMLLRENLPLAYGVATGEIIPYKGRVSSRQCDIIIYDQLRYPIIGKTEAVQQVPLEAVFAEIEVRSILDANALKDANDKFIEVLKMPRCNARTKLRKGMSRKPEFFVFAYKMNTTVDQVLDFKKVHNSDWTVAALDHGISITIDNDKGPRHLWLDTTQPNKGRYETLAWFYMALLHGVSQIDLGMPEYFSILNSDG